MFATRRINAVETLAYIVSQCAGAIIAALILNCALPEASVAGAKLGATLGQMSNDVDSMKVLLLEAIATFLLLTTIFGVAVDSRGPKNIYGFAIGLTVAFDILCIGKWTGASMNPARSLGPALVGGHWDIHWVYWAGPILGACLAGFLWDALHLTKEDKVGGGS